MIETSCEECKLKIRAKSEAMGKQIKCPQCRTIIHIPESKHEAAPEVEDSSTSRNDIPKKKNNEVVQKPGTMWAIASLVCGILSILSSWFIIIGLPLGICAIVFYALQNRTSPHGMATGGLVTGISGVILSVTVGGCLMALGMYFSSQKPMTPEVYEQIRTGMTMKKYDLLQVNHLIL